MGLFTRIFGKASAAIPLSVARLSTSPPTVTISGDHKFATAAVGEYYSQPAITRLVKKYALAGDLESGRLFIDGVVRPEPTNIHDPNALIVLIDGVKVGYIAAVRTSLFRRAALRIIEEKSGVRIFPGADWVAKFAMRIGWVPESQDLLYGVTIDTPANFYNH